MEKHFLDQAIKLVREGKTFVFVLNNIDWDVRVHGTRSNNQTKSVHAVASSIVCDRLSSKHLPDDGPKRNVGSTNVIDLLRLKDEDRRSKREQYKIFLERSCAISSQHLTYSQVFFPQGHLVSMKQKWLCSQW